MFNLKLAAILIAALTLAGVAPKAANASIVYDLTLTPTSGGNIGGTGSITISAAPLTGFQQQSSYFQTPQGNSGTLFDLTITIGGDVFTLAQKNANSNPLIRFTSGVIDTIQYAGTLANGDSLMITDRFVYFTAQDRHQEFGNFSATLHIAPAVPEPSTWAMMILGFAGVGFLAYRRRNQVAAL